MKPFLILTFFLALHAAPNPLHSQQIKWKTIAPNALQPVQPNGRPQWGSIKVHDSLVLAGWQNMVLSTDLGKTWTSVSAPIGTYVEDLDIYDDHTFAFITESQAFYTSDRGFTWTKLRSVSSGRIIFFDGSPQKVIVGDEGGKVVLITVGVGVRTLSFPNYPNMISMMHAADGSLRGVGYTTSSEGVFVSSTDDGQNWQIHQSIHGGDNNSFLADPSDPNRFVVTNEDYYFRTDDNADLFLTTDNGDSWQNPYSNTCGAIGDLSGNSATGCHDYFVGTQTRGILRSTDKGLTWNSIGGPVTAMDSRSLAAASDSLVFAIDESGSIWSTDPVSIGVGIVIVTGDQFFRQLNIAPCDTSVTGTIFFTNITCTKLNVLKIELTGKDTSLYKIIGKLSKPLVYPDSIRIRFTPSGSGKTDAHLKLTFADGTTKLIDIGVDVSLPILFLSQGALFLNDTISTCSSDSSTLVFMAPCALDLFLISVTGTDAASFFVRGKTSASLPKDSLLKIICIPQHSGNLVATLHLAAKDGRIWDVPMNLFVRPTALEFKPSSLFGKDSIALCSSDSGMIVLSALCPLSLSSLSITGTDASSFTIAGKTSASLPSDSIVKIFCIPQHSGDLSAALHILGSDGRTWDIPLNIFVEFTPLVYQPAYPFKGDTISVCVSDTGTIVLSAPCALDLSSLSITGSDAGSFILAGKNSALLPADSIVKIFCMPQHFGKLSAMLHIVGSDGRIWDIALDRFAAEPDLQMHPASLFVRDSIEYCSMKNDSVLLKALCGLDLASISLAGTDASSFILLGKSSAALPADSIVLVSCIPQHPGLLSASLHIVTAGGASWDVPLSPFIEASPTIAFDQNSITNGFTDTIGGDVSVPIIFHHTGSPAGAEFTIHYDTVSLDYHGVFDLKNTDHTIGHPDTHSARIAFTTTRDSIFSARFSFYPVDSACTHITVDSLTGAAGFTKCLSILGNSARADICSPRECGRKTIAIFIRQGIVPQLSVIPNPGSGTFTISSSRPLGFVTISVTDKLGIVRVSQNSELSSTQNAKLNLESLPSGMYFIRVSAVNSVLPVVLEK